MSRNKIYIRIPNWILICVLAVLVVLPWFLYDRLYLKPPAELERAVKLQKQLDAPAPPSIPQKPNTEMQRDRHAYSRSENQLKVYEEQAQKGDCRAIMELAQYYGMGLLYEEAQLYWLRFGAEHNCVECQRDLIFLSDAGLVTSETAFWLNRLHANPAITTLSTTETQAIAIIAAEQ